MATCPDCGEFFDEENESQRGFCGNCGEYQYGEGSEYDELTPEEREEQQHAKEQHQKAMARQKAAFRAGILAGVDRNHVKAAWFLDDVLVECPVSYEDEERSPAGNVLRMAEKIRGLLRQPAARNLQIEEEYCGDWREIMTYAPQGGSPFPSLEEVGFSEVRPVMIKRRIFQGDEYCDPYEVHCYGFLIISNQYGHDLALRADLGEKLLALRMAEWDKARHDAERQRVKGGLPPEPPFVDAAEEL